MSKKRMADLEEKLRLSKQLSESRRNKLIRLSAERAAEWKRAENAEAERDRYREALERISAGNPAMFGKWLSDVQMADLARAALSGSREGE